MARMLKEADIKPALKLATSATKELVIAGVNGEDYHFPTLLANYTWTGTRDYNMALIIIAFYAYCTRSKNLFLKKFGIDALKKGSNSNKLFEHLKKGDGKKVKNCMGLYFKRALNIVLEGALPHDKDKRGKIIKSFITQAEKITPWKINGKDISNVIDQLLSNRIKKDGQIAFAIKSGGMEKVKEVLGSMEVDLNELLADGEPVLTFAIINNKKDIVKYFLDKGADPNIENKYGDTPLHLAVSTEIVELLLEKGADPNIENKDGDTPLHLAVSYSRTEIEKLLLEKGANPNIKVKFCGTPLHWAVRCGYSEIVKLLLEKGADPTIEDKYGDTPLHLAAARGCTEIVELLLKNDVDPNIKSKNNKTPLVYAIQAYYKYSGRSNDLYDTIKVLFDYDGKPEPIECLKEYPIDQLLLDVNLKKPLPKKTDK